MRVQQYHGTEHSTVPGARHEAGAVPDGPLRERLLDHPLPDGGAWPGPGGTGRPLCSGLFGEALPPVTGSAPELDPNTELLRCALRGRIWGLHSKQLGGQLLLPNQSSRHNHTQGPAVRRDLTHSLSCSPRSLNLSQVRTPRPREPGTQPAGGRMKMEPSHCELLPQARHTPRTPFGTAVRSGKAGRGHPRLLR